MSRRVVVTGMGVVAPNGHGLDEYERALRTGASGVRRVDELARLGFRCHVAGIPPVLDELRARYFPHRYDDVMRSNTLFAGAAAIDCWRDAGFEVPPAGEGEVDFDTGAIIGTNVGNPELFGDFLAPETRAGNVRRLGSGVVSEVMSSAVTLRLGGLLALGNKLATTSSACVSGTEAIVESHEMVASGRATRMLAGGSDAASSYVWAPLDALRLLAWRHNDQPERASRPLSASSSGIVPAGGAAVLMLESLDSARARGARIWAEVLGGAVSSGGQRGGGGMATANPEGVVRCVRQALGRAGIAPGDVDLVNGHLTGTVGDVLELEATARAFGVAPRELPAVQATKSLIGHALGAAGALEAVAVVLELAHGFVHPTINCDDLRPEAVPFAGSIVREPRDRGPTVVLKTSLGFGDVDGCVVFRRWEES